MAALEKSLWLLLIPDRMGMCWPLYFHRTYTLWLTHSKSKTTSCPLEHPEGKRLPSHVGYAPATAPMLLLLARFSTSWGPPQRKARLLELMCPHDGAASPDTVCLHVAVALLQQGTASLPCVSSPVLALLLLLSTAVLFQWEHEPHLCKHLLQQLRCEPCYMLLYHRRPQRLQQNDGMAASTHMFNVLP